MIAESKATRLLRAFRAGEELTPKQIAHRFNVVNPRALVYTLRNEGFGISLLKRTNSKGVMRRKYTMRYRVA